MASQDDLKRRIADAKRQLMNLPGVVSVGYGYKQQQGETTGKLSLRVQVREKKPREALDPRDVVPGEINGLRTDVLPMVRVRRAQCEDLRHHEHMIGGIRIGNLKRYLADPSSRDLTIGTGTLGGICTLNDVGGRDNVGFLTCNHVLADMGGIAGDTVYQPNAAATHPQSRDFHPIGRIHNIGHQGLAPYAYPSEAEERFWIDCATARIYTKFSSCCDTNCGVKFDTRIRSLEIPGGGATPGEGDRVAGIERLDVDSLSETVPYMLYKVGAVTGLTIGRAVDLGSVFDDETGEEQLEVFQMEYTGPNCDGGFVTADHGDSGSVVLNRDRKVVGVLYATDALLGARASVCHIHPVLSILNASVRTTGSGPVESGGGTLSVRNAVLLPPTPTRERAAALRQQIMFSRKGKDLYRLVHEHREEVIHLVNRLRPVTVAWHRNRGPDFLAQLIEASRDTLHRVPSELEGVSRPAALARVLDTLGQYGSSELRRDIDEHRAYLDYLARDVHDMEQLAELLLPEAGVKAG